MHTFILLLRAPSEPLSCHWSQSTQTCTCPSHPGHPPPPCRPLMTYASLFQSCGPRHHQQQVPRLRSHPHASLGRSRTQSLLPVPWKTIPRGGMTGIPSRWTFLSATGAVVLPRSGSTVSWKSTRNVTRVPQHYGRSCMSGTAACCVCLTTTRHWVLVIRSRCTSWPGAS